MRASRVPYWLLRLSLDDCLKHACALARSLFDVFYHDGFLYQFLYTLYHFNVIYVLIFISYYIYGCSHRDRGVNGWLSAL
jgi:hypothetical protein